MTALFFRSWYRSDLYNTASSDQPVNGRLRGSVNLTARDRSQPSVSHQESVDFVIAGPRDVGRLRDAAIRAVYPEADAVAIETTFCCTVELAATDLPWRYTPQHHDGETLPPWIVLVVGTTAEVSILPGRQVRLSGALLNDHPLTESPLWAHVQEDANGVETARLVAARTLQPRQEHVAVVVPAFDEMARPSWGPDSAAPDADDVELTAHYHWRFTTGHGGDFLTLADQLAGRVVEGSGDGLTVDYARFDSRPTITVPAALRPAGATTYPAIPPAIAADAATLAQPLVDNTGRRAVAPPTYGELWHTPVSGTAWGDGLNANPALRIAAGLGVAAAFSLERQLVTAAIEQAGDFATADQSISRWSLGNAASVALWETRLPTDAIERLAVLGPSLGRMVTSSGATVLEEATGEDRPLPAELYSGAAQRLLRPAAAWVRLAQPGAAGSELWERANRCTTTESAALARDLIEDWSEFTEELAEGAEGIDVDPELPEPFVPDIGGEWAPAPCNPIDLEHLAGVAAAAVDPRDGRVGERIIATLDGVEDLRPPELEPHLDVPLWTFLRDHAPTWLLPNLVDMPTDALMLLQPNAAFIEAFMIGANTRLLEALRRYDLRIGPRSTPLKSFWGRFDDDGALLADMGDIANFDLDGEVGSHMIASKGGAVLAARSDLFKRYPDAMLFLIEADRDAGGDPVFESFEDADLQRPRHWPSFQGGLDDIVLFGFDLAPDDFSGCWIVIEEGPRDRRFLSEVTADAPPLEGIDGASFARRHLTGPYRVVLPAARLVVAQP